MERSAHASHQNPSTESSLLVENLRSFGHLANAWANFAQSGTLDPKVAHERVAEAWRELESASRRLMTAHA